MEVLNDDAVAHYNRAKETAAFLEGKVDDQIAETRAESAELMQRHQQQQEAIDQRVRVLEAAMERIAELEEAGTTDVPHGEDAASPQMQEADLVNAVLQQMDQRFGLIYQEDVNDLEEQVQAVQNRSEASINSLALELEQARAESVAMANRGLQHTEHRHAEAMEVLQDDAVAAHTKAKEQQEALAEVDDQIAEARAESAELMRRAVLHTEVRHQQQQEAIDQLRTDTITAQTRLEEESVAANSEVPQIEELQTETSDEDENLNHPHMPTARAERR